MPGQFQIYFVFKGGILITERILLQDLCRAKAYQQVSDEHADCLYGEDEKKVKECELNSKCESFVTTRDSQFHQSLRTR